MINLEEFKAMKFDRRTAPVSVPGLPFFFDKGETLEFIVHGLTGSEVAKARERVKHNAALNVMVENILSEKSTEKIQGIQQALGIGTEEESDLVYRIAICEFGIVSIDFDQEGCVKLANVCPESFYLISSKILELTGLGQVHLGESNASGAIKGSEMPLNCAPGAAADSSLK